MSITPSVQKDTSGAVGSLAIVACSAKISVNKGTQLVYAVEGFRVSRTDSAKHNPTIFIYAFRPKGYRFEKLARAMLLH